MAKHKKKRKTTKRNTAKPQKLRKIRRTTGWMRASAVRFVKKGGRTEVYIPRSRPRKKKTSRRRR